MNCHGDNRGSPSSSILAILIILPLLITLPLLLSGCGDDEVGKPSEPAVLRGRVIDDQQLPVANARVGVVYQIPTLARLSGETILPSDIPSAGLINARSNARSNALFQNYPNPFPVRTVLRFDLSHDSHVRLSILDRDLKWVVTLIEGLQDAGIHTVVWNTRDLPDVPLPNGNYFARLEIGGDDTGILLHRSIFLQTAEPEQLAMTADAITDSEGRFEIEFEALSVGEEVVLTAEEGTEVGRERVMSRVTLKVLAETPEFTFFGTKDVDLGGFDQTIEVEIEARRITPARSDH